MKKSWLAALMLAVLLLPGAALAQSAVVNNGSDPSSRLNMRSAPSRDAQAVGKFVSGTQVEILSDEGNGWALVRIGSGDAGVTGYMMRDYLKDSSSVDARERRAVASPYGTQSVVLRNRPSNSYHPVAMLAVGEMVTVIGVSGDFCYVVTGGGQVGCLLSGELR
ncbi:MAG: SH3 domain-containing protein [Clostridia bacterium]|nr:SH3 domain-containing protein [Clostridia bacterium]